MTSQRATPFVGGWRRARRRPHSQSITTQTTSSTGLHPPPLGPRPPATSPRHLLEGAFSAALHASRHRRPAALDVARDLFTLQGAAPGAAALPLIFDLLGACTRPASVASTVAAVRGAVDEVLAAGAGRSHALSSVRAITTHGWPLSTTVLGPVAMHMHTPHAAAADVVLGFSLPTSSPNTCTRLPAFVLRGCGPGHIRACFHTAHADIGSASPLDISQPFANARAPVRLQPRAPRRPVPHTRRSTSDRLRGSRTLADGPRQCW